MFRHKKVVIRRKKHRNSKLGCIMCKRRRIKCLEDLPACANCVKYHLRCGYLDFSERELEEFREQKRIQSILNEDPTRGSYDKTHPGDISALGFNLVGGASCDGVCNEMKNALSDIQVMLPIGFAESTPRALLVELDPASFCQCSGNQILHNSITVANSRAKDSYYLVGAMPENEHTVIQTPKRPLEGSLVPTRDYFHQPLPILLYGLMKNQSSSVLQLTPLPGAMHTGNRFNVATSTISDYQLLLQLGRTVAPPNSARSKVLLVQMRRIYYLCMAYFISKAHKLDVIFSGLITLTTNYLVTCLVSGHSTLLYSLLLSPNLRNTLAVHLLLHYYTAIRCLVHMLESDNNPEIATFMLHLLMLVSIYDPREKLDSTKCFRDGMFTVLSYTSQLAYNESILLPQLIPIHLRLMTDVVRAVYFPAYDPVFLIEFETMLRLFSAIVDLANDLPISRQMRRKYNDLVLFAQDTIHQYIPGINQNLDDINYQEELLFKMLRRWALIQPTENTTLCTHADPLDYVVNLFSRLFCKALFAVVPQVQYFLLCDFDLPFMFDLFADSKNLDMFSELQVPLKCMLSEVYALQYPKVRAMYAYAFRLKTFLQIRLTMLYDNLVYNESVRQLCPIENVIELRRLIVDIKKAREHIREKIGLLEYPIKSFMLTYISPFNFPHIVEPSIQCASVVAPSEAPQLPQIEGIEEVDLMSLQPNGLLLKDVHPLIG